MAYIAFAIGIDLGRTVIVRPDGQLPMPKFLNFPNSLWDPYQESGFFSVLEPQYQSFYPLAYFLRFKANTLTFNVFLLLNFALAGFGLFCYLTEINLNVYASILGGITFMLSGFMAGHKMHIALISAAAWIPLVLLFLERSLKDESQRSLQLIYGAFALGLLVLAGYPAMIIDAAIVVSVYALFRIFGDAFPTKTAIDKLLVLFKSLLFLFIPALALGSIAIVPVFESFPLINRSQLSFAEFSRPGWQVDALPMVIFPFFYGNHARGLYPSPYFGPAYLWEISWFVGALPLSLCLFTFLIRKRVPEARSWMACLLLGVCLVGGAESPPLYRLLPKSLRSYTSYVAVSPAAQRWWFVLAAVLLVSAFVCGVLLWLKRNPRHQFLVAVFVTLVMVLLASPLLYRLLYHVPIFNLFRAPARYLFLVDLAMSILAAIGFNHLIENRSESKALAPSLKKLSMLMGLLTLLSVVYYLAILPKIRMTTPGFPTMGLHLLFPLTAIVITIVALNAARWWASNYFVATLVAFAFVDLITFSRFHYSQGTIAPRWDCLKIKALEHEYATFKVSLAEDREGMCGLLGIHGNHPIWFKHYVNMVGLGLNPSSHIRDNPALLENSSILLRVLSVKYVSDTKALLQNAASLGFALIEERGQEALYVNTRFLPRIRFAKRLQRINDFEEARALIYGARFDPEDVVLLTDVLDKRLSQGEIIESRFENDSIRIKAKTGEEAFLVFSDSWHPGWRVFVDGKSATLAKPYAFQMGVRIFGSGEHVIEFRLEPTTGYLVGKWISVMTLSLMVCFVGYSLRPAAETAS